MKKAKISGPDFDLLMHTLLEHVILVPFEDFEHEYEHAMQIMEMIDENDAPFLAVGLALGIGSIILAVLSWFRYPYIFGLLAIVFGGVVLFKSGNKKSWQAILGILGIIAGLACIITDIFYFTIFPIPPLVLT